jgi:hypothetical protein
LSCGGSDDEPGKAWEPCNSTKDCESGHSCLEVGDPSGRAQRCVPKCEADDECPAYNDGVKTVCDLDDGLCFRAVCFGGSGVQDFACVDGILTRCDTLEGAPCSECPGVCTESQRCDIAEERCVERKAEGQQCESSDDCLNGNCFEIDERKFCGLPAGTACWTGDPCNCDDGSCSYSCDGADQCPGGTTCLFFYSVGGPLSGSCRKTCAEGSSECGENAVCEPHSNGNPTLRCYSTGTRPPRPDGWLCEENDDCESANCCPAPDGLYWGQCAPMGGC